MYFVCIKSAGFATAIPIPVVSPAYAHILLQVVHSMTCDTMSVTSIPLTSSITAGGTKLIVWAHHGIYAACYTFRKAISYLSQIHMPAIAVDFPIGLYSGSCSGHCMMQLHRVVANV